MINMATLFNDEDSGEEEIVLKINHGYESSYNRWREKEELEKLKARLGNDPMMSSSSESEDDEALASLIDKDFLKTLSALKGNDPKIYDKNVTFHKGLPEMVKTGKKKKKEKPLYLAEHEQKMMIENQEGLSDLEEDIPQSLSYHQEQNEIRQSFKDAWKEEDDDGAIIKPRLKTAGEKKDEEEEYISWLKDNSKVKEEAGLEHLKQFWSNPSLDKGEAFLKDYILNKRYIDREKKDLTYNQLMEEDEEEKLEEFEHKFNFRFEEPDAEFVKHYPRTMENSMRKPDTKRKLQRLDHRERKQAEKDKKTEEIKRLKFLKRKEILEKLERLKEISGNQKLGFEEMDLETDFDSAEHDRRMNEEFGDEFYGKEVGDDKPIFPEDEEFDEENWDEWDGQEMDEGLHCEDPAFNMDADYEPKQKQEKEKKTNGKKRSKFAQAIAKKKPVFDPNSESFEEYFDEYYKLDFEDLIGDMPVRFNYRRVTPNSYGLTTEEILLADDRELNRWCSLRKMSQYKTEEEEAKDLNSFEQKRNNLEMKRKYLPSLFKEPVDDGEIQATTLAKRKRRRKKKNLDGTESFLKGAKVKTSLLHIKEELTENRAEKSKESLERYQIEESENKEFKHLERVSPIENKVDETRSSKKKRKKSKKEKEISEGQQDPGDLPVTDTEAKKGSQLKKKRKNPNDRNKWRPNQNQTSEFSDNRLLAYGFKPKKFRRVTEYLKNKQ